MLSRGQWGLYLAGMGTEALFVLSLSLAGFMVAVLAMATYR